MRKSCRVFWRTSRVRWDVIPRKIRQLFQSLRRQMLVTITRRAVIPRTTTTRLQPIPNLWTTIRITSLTWTIFRGLALTRRSPSTLTTTRTASMAISTEIIKYPRVREFQWKKSRIPKWGLSTGNPKRSENRELSTPASSWPLCRNVSKRPSIWRYLRERSLRLPWVLRKHRWKFGFRIDDPNLRSCIKMGNSQWSTVPTIVTQWHAIHLLLRLSGRVTAQLGIPSSIRPHIILLRTTWKTSITGTQHTLQTLTYQQQIHCTSPQLRVLEQSIKTFILTSKTFELFAIYFFWNANVNLRVSNAF